MSPSVDDGRGKSGAVVPDDGGVNLSGVQVRDDREVQYVRLGTRAMRLVADRAEIVRFVGGLEAEYTATDEEIAALRAGRIKGLLKMFGCRCLTEIGESFEGSGFQLLLMDVRRAGEKFLHDLHSAMAHRSYEGFLEYAEPPIEMESWMHYFFSQSTLPPHLQGLSREEIGYSNTVITAKDARGLDGYKIMHGLMVDDLRRAGVKLVLGVVWVENIAVKAHEALGYEIMKNSDGTPAVIDGTFKNPETGEDRHGQYFLVYVDLESEFQKNLAESARAGRRSGAFDLLDLDPHA